MTVTAENIRDDIVGNLANRTDITDSTLYRYIHYAQTRVSRLKVFNELNTKETITANIDQGRYFLWSALPEYRRIKKIDSIIPERTSDNTYEATLIRIPTIKAWNKILAGREVTDTSDVPTHYLFHVVDELEIRPIPKEEYTLHLSLSLHPVEVAESNKTDELSIYTADDLIMQLATSMLAFKLGLEDKGTHYFRAYSASIKELLKQESDHADFNMQAVRADLNITTPSTYWADPFYHGTGEQV